MGFIGDIMRGAMILSFIAVAQHGCSVKSMAGHATKAHQKGLTSYGAYSRALTCLLYTSPSPRDRTRSRMPSSA